MLGMLLLRQWPKRRDAHRASCTETACPQTLLMVDRLNTSASIGRQHLRQDARGYPERNAGPDGRYFPTDCFAASRFLKNLNQRDRDGYTAGLVGCGPVGVCAITCALTMVKTVYAIDFVPERLAEAEKNWR
jgi:hypothetical protein